MLSAVVIDDDPSVLSFLTRELLQMGEIGLSGYASNLKDGRALLSSAKPDLVFLDVELPDGLGFDIVDCVGDAQIVFVTAFEEYAIRAFDCAAIDYLLKPIDANRLGKSMERCLLGRDQDWGRQVELLRNNMTENEQGHQLLIKTGYGYEVIAILDILYCQANGNYTTVHLKGGEELLSSKTLKEFEKLLQGYAFFRCHQSFLINVREVKGFKNFKSEIKLTSGISVSLARSKQHEFKNLLSKLKTL